MIVRVHSSLENFGKRVMKLALSSLLSLEPYHHLLTDSQPLDQMTQEDGLTPSGIVHDQLQ